MHDTNHSELMDSYDRVMSLLENLRIIAYGGAALLEESCPAISRILRRENLPELRARFTDGCGALFWIRDELITFSAEEADRLQKSSENTPA